MLQTREYAIYLTGVLYVDRAALRIESSKQIVWHGHNHLRCVLNDVPRAVSVGSQTQTLDDLSGKGSGNRESMLLHRLRQRQTRLTSALGLHRIRIVHSHVLLEFKDLPQLVER